MIRNNFDYSLENTSQQVFNEWNQRTPNAMYARSKIGLIAFLADYMLIILPDQHYLLCFRLLG